MVEIPPRLLSSSFSRITDTGIGNIRSIKTVAENLENPSGQQQVGFTVPAKVNALHFQTRFSTVALNVLLVSHMITRVIVRQEMD